MLGFIALSGCFAVVLFVCFVSYNIYLSEEGNFIVVKSVAV